MKRFIGVMGLAMAFSAGAEEVPTFSGQVAEIVYTQCTPCHRPDGGAPLSLTSYEEISRRARMIAKVTASGQMPPWKVDHSDLRFKNERGLPEAQQAILAAWAKAGAPLGDAAAVPELPAFASGWTHGTPDLVLEMEQDMPIPASGTDIYRNFVIKIPDLPEGKYLAGLEYAPKAATTAHHTLFSIDSTGRSRKLSESQPRPGFSGGAGSGAMGRIAGWAVGSVPAMFPADAAITIPPGSDLVLSSHFHPTGKDEVERSQVALYLTDEAPARSINTLDVPFMFGALKNIRIPAGDSHYVVKEEFTIPTDANLAYLSPHAHYLATTMDATATLPDGTELSLISIKNWDFGWQEQYELAEEMLLPAGTRIEMEFVYDNSAENPFNPSNPPREVTWGLQSTDEMACITLGLITPTQEAKDALRDGYIAWVKNDVATADPSIVLASFQAMSKDRFDMNGDGEVSWAETWTMTGQIYSRIRNARQPGSGEMGEVRAQILPLILRRVFRLVVLPWLLPRAAILAVVFGLLLYALRQWRKRRRARVVLATQTPAESA
ncbi:MAG: hypothetical protein GC168_02420 [Candidatus Hydrogenedens sp.]|nr:hypothetical protein [Candidatus Hydrogenedens sp.]